MGQRSLVDQVEGFVVGRRHDPAAFRPDPSAAQRLAPSRRQAAAMIAGLVLVAGTVAVASFAVQPNTTQAFDLFYGSVFLNDERAPVAVDLTNGKPTVRLVDANTQVSAKRPSDLDAVPLANSTLLLDTATGEFNMLDSAGFVIKTKNGGVPLPKRAGTTTSAGIAAGASAYVIQAGPSGTSVYLVGQSTVQSATGSGAKVKPRAYAVMDEPGSTAPGGAASANGDLWLGVGSGGSRTIRQLTLPRGSDAGVTLHSADRATVPAVSAIGATTGRAGGDVVGVGAPSQVQVFDGNDRAHTYAVNGLAGVDRILAASNQDNALSFLYHSTAGWSLVSVPAAGSGGVGPVALRGVDPAAQLAAPAASNGQLFTMDAGTTGRVWQIGPRGDVQTPAGAGSYPIVRDASGRAAEVADFGDAYAIARGSRVVFDSASHVQALALFTDGSHAPVSIDKSAAVSLNAAGDATALTDARTPKKATGPKAPVKAPAQPISDKIRCKTTTQVPHIPTITQATPGSRSVQLQWTYPLLDTRDCAPSTYTVSVHLLSSAAPSPPAAVTVQGQDGVNLTGLFPDTRYKITVTAYLNGRGTPSTPVEIATGPEGPAAPTSVQTATDSSGNWTVTWNSCGGVAQGCVPTATWSVIPSFCDGSGLSSAPATISIAGDPTQHTFTARFPGNDSILGRGLSFQVEGIGSVGTVGTPAGDHGCSYSWSRPVASAMTVTASQPPNTSLGGSATTTVTLALGPNPVRDVGGVGARVTFRLAGPAGTQTQGPITVTGSSSHISATFRGVQAGAQYAANALVSAPKHPDAVVTVGPVSVATRADWPNVSVSANCPPDPGLIVLTCTLTADLGGISSASANGERFDLADGSAVQCGSTGFGLTKDNFDPARESIRVDNVSLLLYNGTCTLTVALIEDPGARPPLVFGGTVSRSASTSVDLGSASTLGATQGDFSATWDSAGGASNVQVKYSGSKRDQDVAKITTGWAEQIKAPGGADCGSANEQATSRGVDIPVDPTCVNRFGGQTTGWSIAVSYQDTAGGAGHSFTYQLSGGPPTYQPCTVAAANFPATWTGTATSPSVGVRFDGNTAQLAGCTNWRYVLKDTTGNECGADSPIGTPSNKSTPIADTCTSSVRTNAWTVTVTYDDTAGAGQTAGSVPVGGTPP